MNSSRTLYQSFLKKDMEKTAAMFAVIDHFTRLHCFDRDRYDERIKQLEARVSELEKK